MWSTLVVLVRLRETTPDKSASRLERLPTNRRSSPASEPPVSASSRAPSRGRGFAHVSACKPTAAPFPTGASLPKRVLTQWLTLWPRTPLATSCDVALGEPIPFLPLIYLPVGGRLDPPTSRNALKDFGLCASLIWNPPQSACHFRFGSTPSCAAVLYVSEPVSPRG